MQRTPIISKPVRVVLLWQLGVTVASALLAGLLAGMHGALSAALGGAVSLCAGSVSAAVAGWGGAKSAGGILFGALRAEGVKIGLIAILLWMVLASYAEVVMPAFLGTFMATILIFSMAFFVREHE